MIVVATEDFEVYHGVVQELRDRDAVFTTIEPADPIPDRAAVVITDEENREALIAHTPVVADPDEPRRAVDAALARLRGSGGRTVVGVDPGRKPAIAVLSGDTVVAAFQVPPTDAVPTILEEVADAPAPVVRVGDGARQVGAQIVNDLDTVRVELVDETGTTPFLGAGTRGMGDVLAAVNIARIPGEPIDRREIEPTAGELQVIKDRSRDESETNRAISEGLARRVATGELSIEEALAEHRAGHTRESN